MIQVNRIYLIFNRLVTKKFLVDTSEQHSIINKLFIIDWIFLSSCILRTSLLCFHVTICLLVRKKKSMHRKKVLLIFSKTHIGVTA